MMARKASKGGNVPLKKMFILPIVFLAMSVDELITGVSISWAHVLAWVVGVTLGTLAGWWQLNSLQIEVDHAHKILKMPPSKFALALIILTFLVKYYIGFQLSTTPILTLKLAMALIVVSGVFTGVFVGRLFYSLYLFKAPKVKA